MKNLFAFLFGNFLNRPIVGFGPSKRSVDGALVHFNKALAELEAVEEQEKAEAERKRIEIEQASAALEASTKEATRARNVAGRIRNLLGEDFAADARLTAVR